MNQNTSTKPKTKNTDIIQNAIKSSLDIIEQEREQEIIMRRFGLNGHRETLEQIGAFLNITRERVRQLEKAILIHLRIGAEENEITDLAAAEKLIIRKLTELGRVARTEDLASQIFDNSNLSLTKQCAMLNFVATISPSLVTIDESDNYYAAVGIADYGDTRQIHAKVDEIVKTLKQAKKALTLDELDELLNYEHPDHIKAIASISKQLSALNGYWGLSKWPTVNPRNIRDKIFVVLNSNKEPMHFSEIAAAISNSDFHRRNVTVQAIHNELIKDSRFVLIGRGIYALDSWGYIRGTVADVIKAILAEAGEPLSREEIVKRVLKVRKVKETTILLNLQNRQLFDKVDQNLYTVAT